MTSSECDVNHNLLLASSTTLRIYFSLLLKEIARLNKILIDVETPFRNSCVLYFARIIPSNSIIPLLHENRDRLNESDVTVQNLN